MTGLVCALCFYTRDVPGPAVTVMGGYAACDDHAQHFQTAFLESLVAAHLRGAL